MLVLGDSIAAGIGAPHVSLGCMSLLRDRLLACFPGLEMVNLAHPGESSSSLVRSGGQVERALDVISEVTRRGGRVAPVLLSVGGNDAMEASTWGEEEAAVRLRRNLAAVLGGLDHALRRAGSLLSGSACLQTVYNPFEPAAGDAPDADELAPRRARGAFHNRELRVAAARFAIDIADVASAFRGRAAQLTWIRSGDVHPSADGHEVIARTYVDACGWDSAVGAAADEDEAAGA
jgi:lysophospholipase L1-like esterase